MELEEPIYKYKITDEDSLAAVLRKTRIGKNEKQVEASKAVGVSRFTWIYWEIGMVPRPDKWERLAAWAGLPIAVLVKFATKPSTATAPRWLDLALGHVKSAGEEGLSHGELRQLLVALDNRALKKLLAAAERQGFIEHRGQGSLLRYYRTDKKLTS